MANQKIDITKYLVPIYGFNANCVYRNEQNYTSTTDLVKIDSVKDLGKYSFNNTRSITDFAVDNCGRQSDIFTSDYGRPTSSFWTSDCYIGYLDTSAYVETVNVNGQMYYESTANLNLSICPVVNLDLSHFIDSNEDYSKIFKIKEIKTIYGKKHILEMGEYPKSNVDEHLQRKLEFLYNKGNLRSGIVSTGRLYTTNGQRSFGEDFLSKQNPEFILDGEKYVRVITWNGFEHNKYSDDSKAARSGEIRWKKVEPITFEIRNWKSLSNNINPRGKKQGTTILDLKTEEGILSGIPFYPNEMDRYRNEWQNSLIRCFLNSARTEDLHISKDARTVCKWDFRKSGFMYQAFNLAREPIKEYVIPKNEKEICENAFAGCVGIEKIVIHNNITKVGVHAFDGCSFRWAYFEKRSKNLVLSQNLPEDKSTIENILDLQKFSDSFDNFDYSVLLNSNKSKDIVHFANILKSNKLKMPYSFIEALERYGKIDEYLNNSDFRFFKSEFPNLDDLLSEQTMDEKLCFFKFASIFGCFSKEKMKDKDGKETQVLMAQKASSLFSLLVKNNVLQIGQFNRLFDLLSLKNQPDQDFLKFLSERGDKGKFQNAQTLVNLSDKYTDMFAKVMTNFQRAKSFRTTLNEEGKPTTISWPSAFKKFYSTTIYKGVTDSNQDIATLFGSLGLNQHTFNVANIIRENAKRKEVPSHILGKPLKEDTILESLEKMKKQTGELLGESKDIVDKLFEKKFTYEMLDKYDPHNVIIGLFCSCCCTIDNLLYGQVIARSSTDSPDIQNLVVRDAKGEIVAKGTMYINKKLGYVVFNDFEINQRYKKHEINCGYYDVDPASKEEQEREMIFNALVRGVEAFVKEYDAQNPNNPIKKVNVGMGYNRLKLQCKKFKKETRNLNVPMIYAFEDASKEQRILYERSKAKKQEVKEMELK